MGISRMTMMASLTHCRPLTCAASGGSPYPARIVSHPPDLIKWVKREGGFVHEAVEILENGKNGVGIIATQQIPKGSQLIALPPHIPLNFLPSELDDVATSLLLNLVGKVPEELWAMKLGLKLLQERAKVGSFWWPYISNLPETYSVPIFFPGDDIKNLQYAPILHQINKRCRFLLEFEKEVKCALEGFKPDDHPFGGQYIDASSFGWAMSAVSSRAFRLHGKRLPNGTRVDVPTMLPLIDMCNHCFNPNAKIVQEEDKDSANMPIKVVAETSIEPNDSVLLNYGCLSNDLFLLDYGFVITSNPYDCIELKYDGNLLDAASMAAGVSAQNFSSPAPWQQRFLSQLNLDGETANLKVKIGGEEVVEGRLLAALRVMLSSDMEKVKTYDLNTLKSLSAAAPLGIGNEIAAFRTVIALCVIALGHFPTKIVDDEALLRRGVSASTELAIQFRIQKKQVIVDVMTYLSRRIKSLMSENVIANQS